tara:strand:+ start:10889 stop:11038 length:150 start_codon:yes stop_codon:yes gene_type:complete
MDFELEFSLNRLLLGVNMQDFYEDDGSYGKEISVGFIFIKFNIVFYEND